MKTLDGRVAVVTGGGSGIGRETAKVLAAAGALVVIAGRRKPPLESVVDEIEYAGGRAVAYPADLENAETAAALGRWTVDTHGRIDILVHSAGHSSRARNILWIDQPDWESVLAVNLTGVFALTQAVLPSMLEQGGGSIITVSSAAALRPGLLSGAAYGAAKAGVRNFMGSIHAMFRNQGIRSTTILPAEVDTPILDKRPLPPDTKARATMMKPEDVARAILLCVTMPARTVIEEIVMSPTILRDQSADIAANRDHGRTDRPRARSADRG